GDTQLGLGHAARREEELARARILRRVLRADAEVEVPHRDPAARAAAADVDDPRVVRERLPERRDRLGCFVLETRDELESACRDLEQHFILAPSAVEPPNNLRAAS